MHPSSAWMCKTVNLKWCKIFLENFLTFITRLVLQKVPDVSYYESQIDCCLIVKIL